jgi:hypothetical protein
MAGKDFYRIALMLSWTIFKQSNKQYNCMNLMTSKTSELKDIKWTGMTFCLLKMYRNVTSLHGAWYIEWVLHSIVIAVIVFFLFFFFLELTRIKIFMIHIDKKRFICSRFVINSEKRDILTTVPRLSCTINNLHSYTQMHIRMCTYIVNDYTLFMFYEDSMTGQMNLKWPTNNLHYDQIG